MKKIYNSNVEISREKTEHYLTGSIYYLNEFASDEASVLELSFQNYQHTVNNKKFQVLLHVN
jgi:hypothetical protein